MATVPVLTSSREEAAQREQTPPTHLPRGGEGAFEKTSLSQALRPRHAGRLNSTRFAALFPEPTHCLLHPCQLINRLSGQVSDIDHLIRTLSVQSPAHLMGLLLSPRVPSCFQSLEQLAVGTTTTLTWNPHVGSPSPDKPLLAVSLGASCLSHPSLVLPSGNLFALCPMLGQSELHALSCVTLERGP